MIITASPASIDGFTSASTVVDGVRLHHWTGGDPDGPPVLLWHGFLATGYVWRKVASALAQAGLSVLIPDLRGYGDSDKPAGTDGYDPRALAEEFRALIRHLDFGQGRPLTLIAHDMGAPPALLWAADHPDEVAGLMYLEGPVLLREVISKVIAFAPQAMEKGSLWWWILPLAPDVPERLIVGNERAFLTWFYDRDPSSRQGIEPAAVDEYLRTFSGPEGVLGALGRLPHDLHRDGADGPADAGQDPDPVVALGGERGQGERVRMGVELVASDVRGGVIADCGHFLPEERPEDIVSAAIALAFTGSTTIDTPNGRSTRMTEQSTTPPHPVPPDDPGRELTLARPDDAGGLPHLSVVGDTYTTLLSGADTAGRFSLIDMYVPPGGGPPSHRHDFEETFTVLEGELEMTFRGEVAVVRTGETVNVPANAPHAFRNASEQAVRLLCICSPPGQEEFFLAIGDRVADRTAPPPELDDDAKAERMAKGKALAPSYRTELLLPDTP